MGDPSNAGAAAAIRLAGVHGAGQGQPDQGGGACRRYYEEFNKLDRPKKGENYSIPYGVLVPKGWTNLWVAGRCVSTDLKVHGAIRDQPSCSMMGQAAGTAAVQSIRTGQPAHELNTEQLVLTLRKAAANLPQTELSKMMTRGIPAKG